VLNIRNASTIPSIAEVFFGQNDDQSKQPFREVMILFV
jgi:hypothetical protein